MKASGIKCGKVSMAVRVWLKTVDFPRLVYTESLNELSKALPLMVAAVDENWTVVAGCHGLNVTLPPLTVKLV